MFLRTIKWYQIYTWHFVILFNWLNGLNTAWYLSQLTAASDHISAKAPTDEQNPYILQPKRWTKRMITIYNKHTQNGKSASMILNYFKYPYPIFQGKEISLTLGTQQSNNITILENQQWEGWEAVDSMQYGVCGS